METFAVNKCMASPACAGTAAPALQALGLYFLAGADTYEPHSVCALRQPMALLPAVLSLHLGGWQVGAVIPSVLARGLILRVPSTVSCSPGRGNKTPIECLCTYSQGEPQNPTQKQSSGFMSLPRVSPGPVPHSCISPYCSAHGWRPAPHLTVLSIPGLQSPGLQGTKAPPVSL